MIPDGELLTAKEACDLLKISASTLERMVARREVRALRLGGSSRRPLRVFRRDLDQALASWSIRGSR